MCLCLNLNDGQRYEKIMRCPLHLRDLGQSATGNGKRMYGEMSVSHRLSKDKISGVNKSYFPPLARVCAHT